MNEDMLRVELEQMGFDSDKIDEAVDVLKKEDKLEGTEIFENNIDDLKKLYDEATDWRTKAKYAAQIVSKGLST